MSQQVNVNKSLVFGGDAANTSNVTGNLSSARMCAVDWFEKDTIDHYTSTLGGTNDAIALVAGGSNGLSLLSGDTDNEVSFLGTGLIFDISNNPEIEAKVRITDVSQTSFFFGFSDANTETTPASTIDYADATLAAAATDAVGFVSDADKVSSLFYAASIATGGAVAAVTTGITPTDTGWYVLRLKVDSTGRALFFINGVAVASVAAAVTDVPLCAVFNFGTRDNGGGDAVYVKYLKMWQDQ